MTMSQPAAGIQGYIAGLNCVPVKDTTKWRTDNGFSGDASSLWVIRYMTGFCWIGSGTPAHDAIGDSDQAYDKDAGVWYSSVNISDWTKQSGL